jgi:hypothetical protein
MNKRPQTGQFVTKRNDVSQVIPFGMDANVFNAPWQEQEIKDKLTYYGTEQQFRKNVSGVKRKNDPFVGQLPYMTTAKTYVNPMIQLIPQSTQINRVCFNEALANSGPFYLRHWQIWDNAPFLPSNGDVTLDPKYMSAQTKGFTAEYQKFPK